MTFIATVKDGKIVVPPGVDLPDGTDVKIEPVKNQPTIWEKLEKYEGAVDDLPSDLAANHDKYFRGRVQE